MLLTGSVVHSKYLNGLSELMYKYAITRAGVYEPWDGTRVSDSYFVFEAEFNAATAEYFRKDYSRLTEKKYPQYEVRLNLGDLEAVIEVWDFESDTWRIVEDSDPSSYLEHQNKKLVIQPAKHLGSSDLCRILEDMPIRRLATRFVWHYGVDPLTNIIAEYTDQVPPLLPNELRGIELVNNLMKYPDVYVIWEKGDNELSDVVSSIQQPESINDMYNWYIRISGHYGYTSSIFVGELVDSLDDIFISNNIEQVYVSRGWLGSSCKAVTFFVIDHFENIEKLRSDIANLNERFHSNISINAVQSPPVETYKALDLRYSKEWTICYPAKWLPMVRDLVYHSNSPAFPDLTRSADEIKDAFYHLKEVYFSKLNNDKDKALVLWQLLLGYAEYKYGIPADVLVKSILPASTGIQTIGYKSLYKPDMTIADKRYADNLYTILSTGRNMAEIYRCLMCEEMK